MKKIKKIKIKSFKSFSGELVPITFNKKFPFLIKRIFFLYGLKNKIRGDHAHKKCSQLFMAVSGKMILNIKTLYKKKKFWFWTVRWEPWYKRCQTEEHSHSQFTH